MMRSREKGEEGGEKDHKSFTERCSHEIERQERLGSSPGGLSHNGMRRDESNLCECWQERFNAMLSRE